MELKECIKNRRSIRRFKDEKVTMEMISQLIDKCVYAPSWKNTQVTRYYAVTGDEMKQKVAACMAEFNQPSSLSASVIMVSTVIRNRSGYTREGTFDTPKGKGWQMYDCGLSNMIFCLAAEEMGLGTVIMGVYDEEAIADVLQIPKREEVVSVIAVGYPAESPDMPKRKEIDVLLKEIK